MKKNQVQIDLGKIKNSCFVVMPFNPLFQSEYENIIQPALTELDIECIRGDEIYSKQRIMDDIWASIRSCRFVLAELTGRNPNVLYEIGLAHAIGKPVIVITRNGDDVPFDLKDLRYLFYDVNDPFWGENLKKGIQSLVKKVMENPDLEKYLEGITKSESTKFQKSNQANKKETPVDDIKNISGNWTGSFNLNGHHNVTLNISQDGKRLSANCVVSMSLGDEPDVVQQIMAGTIYKEKAILKGVNYSFVKRVLLDNYNLDSFEFTEIEDNIIVGVVSDHGAEKGEIRLTKNIVA